MKTIDLSIIVPVYNAQTTLARCVNSFIFQYPPMKFECIIVDDGSTDESFRMAMEYEQYFDGIKVVRQTNGGAGKARNTGMELAQGRYIWFVDSDDYVSEESLYHIAASVSDDYGPDLLLFLYKVWHEASNRMEDMLDRERRIYANAPITSTFTIEQYQDIIHSISYPWNKLYKKSFIIRNNLVFSETPVQNDLYFVVASLLTARTIKMLSKSLYWHTLERNGQLSAINDERRLEALKVFRECDDLVDRLDISPSLLMAYWGHKLNLLLWICSIIREDLEPQVIEYLDRFISQLPECILCSFLNDSRVDLNNPIKREYFESALSRRKSIIIKADGGYHV